MWAKSASGCDDVLGQPQGLGKAKHVDMQNLWIQEASKSGQFTTRKVGTNMSPADLMTKPLAKSKIEQLMGIMGSEFVEEINGGLGAISSISSAMQRLAAGPAEATKPYRVSDLIPNSWDKGQFRNFMAELHSWMQAWSDQGERILVRVERASTRWIDRHWLWVAREQISEHLKQSCEDLAQDDNKGTTEDGPASTGSERIRSLAPDRQEI